MEARIMGRMISALILELTGYVILAIVDWRIFLAVFLLEWSRNIIDMVKSESE